MSDRSDSELARAWIEGDVAAFREVHSRHAGHLMGLACVLTPEPTVALELLHDTFLHASHGIHRLKDPDRLRAWLFALLRATAHHRPGCRRPPDLTVLAERLPDHRSDPLSEPSPRELAEALWTAANGLDSTDKELLELYLLGNLEAGDLAAILGIHPGNAAMLLFQLRERMERTIGALIVARLGRWDCHELDLALQGWDGRFTRTIGTTVTRHVERCPDCARRRRAAFTLDRLSPALPGARPVPAQAKARAVADFARRTPPPVGRSWHFRQDGFPDLGTTQVLPPHGAPGTAPPGPATGTQNSAGTQNRFDHHTWLRSLDSRRNQVLTGIAAVLVLSSSAISLGALMAASKNTLPTLTISPGTSPGSFPSRPWPIPHSSTADRNRTDPRPTSARVAAPGESKTSSGTAVPTTKTPGTSPRAKGSPAPRDVATVPGPSPTTTGSQQTGDCPLSVSPGALALGGTADTGSLWVVNTCDRTVNWSLTITGPGVEATPSAGVLEPQGAVKVLLTLDRSRMVNGAMSASLLFRAEGGTRTVVVSASAPARNPLEQRMPCRGDSQEASVSPTAAPTCQELLDLGLAPRRSRAPGFVSALPSVDLTPQPTSSHKHTPGSPR